MIETDVVLNPSESKSAAISNLNPGLDIDKLKQDLQDRSLAWQTSHQQNAGSILTSEERIAEQTGFPEHIPLEGELSIYNLKAAFEWGFSKLVWQVEQTNKELMELKDILSEPLGTQAREYRNRGEYAYAQGWMQDALGEFLEAEKCNRYDFTVHMYLGLIYLYENKDETKALESFEKAARYARPKSSYYASLALLYQSLIHLTRQDYEKARNTAALASNYTPGFTEAKYLEAKCYSYLDKTDMSLNILEEAIKIDTNYCEKCYNDPDFNPLKKEIDELFLKLYNEQQDKIDKDYHKVRDRAERLLYIIRAKIPELYEKDQALRMDIGKLEHYIGRISTLIKRKSYRDLLEANSIADNCKKYYESVRAQIRTKLKRIIDDLSRKIADQMITTQRQWVDGKLERMEMLNLRLLRFCVMFTPLLIMGGWLILHYTGILAQWGYQKSLTAETIRASAGTDLFLIWLGLNLAGLVVYLRYRKRENNKACVFDLAEEEKQKDRYSIILSILEKF